MMHWSYSIHYFIIPRGWWRHAVMKWKNILTPGCTYTMDDINLIFIMIPLQVYNITNIDCRSIANRFIGVIICVVAHHYIGRYTYIRNFICPRFRFAFSSRTNIDNFPFDPTLKSCTTVLLIFKTIAKVFILFRTYIIVL